MTIFQKTPNKFIILLLFIGAGSMVNAQEIKTFGAKSPWNKGTIVLRDGIKLTGEIKHNEIQGSVLFRSHEMADDQQFVEQSEITELEYEDEREGYHRQFYSLTVNDVQTGKEILDFYEVISVFDDFVVLSKKERLQAQREETNYAASTGYRSLPLGSATTSALTLSQIEHFYFLRENGKPELYLTMEYAYVDATLYKYNRNTGYISDKDIFQKYLGNYWPGVKQHLKENKIRLDNRKGIITALHYYTDLLHRGNKY